MKVRSRLISLRRNRQTFITTSAAGFCDETDRYAHTVDGEGRGATLLQLNILCANWGGGETRSDSEPKLEQTTNFCILEERQRGRDRKRRVKVRERERQILCTLTITDKTNVYFTNYYLPPPPTSGRVHVWRARRGNNNRKSVAGPAPPRPRGHRGYASPPPSN